jgi:hypothetical protein
MPFNHAAATTTGLKSSGISHAASASLDVSAARTCPAGCG